MLKIAVVLLNIFFTVFLIRWNPLIGATIGTFISLMIGDIGVMNFIFIKKLGMNISYYYKGLFKGIVPSILTMIVFGFVISCFIKGAWFAFLLNVLIMVIVYAAAMWTFGMKRYEKNLVLTAIGKIVKKDLRREV
jgi:hypothetical protein